MIDILRRLTIALVALATVLVPAGVLTAPAEAATARCTLLVPARFAISQPYHGIEVRTSGCTPGRGGIGFAAWDGYHPSEGLQQPLMIQSNQRQYWNLYAYAPTGRITWRPMGAFSEDFAGPGLPQNTPTTDVRLASRSTLKAVRTGSLITLTASATRYSPQHRRFVAWTSAAGVIQYRTPGNSGWITLRRVRLNDTGVAVEARRDWATREYRLVTDDRGSVWGSTSLLTRR